MHEIVIVISDLYLAPGQAGGSPEAAGSVTLPGFEHAARFGQRRSIEGEGGWRPWLARWLGHDDLASVAPAVISAAAIPSAAAPSAAVRVSPGALTASVAPTDSAGANRDNIDSRVDVEPSTAIPSVRGADHTAWLATPVHLIAGLTSLHVDRRSILRLSASDLESFAQDFNRTFGDTDLHLAPLANGELLMRGPATLIATTTEPSRALVADLETSLPRGSDAKALKRLGAELEMWLHTHPLNESRQRRGEVPVSTLWLWGGGPLANRAASSPGNPGDVALGPDPYLTGLWHLHGARVGELPADKLASLLATPQVQRAILATEVTPMLHSNPRWTVFDALAELDRLYVAPAIVALRTGAVEKVVLIANDTELQVTPRDRLKFWRRPQPTLLALQPP